MIKTFGTLVLAVALAAGVIHIGAAQQMVRRVEPTPLDAKDPLAIRSASVVKHILAGEKDPAIAALRKEADEAYAKGDAIEKDVDSQIKRLAPGKYRITSYEVGFGADVVVFLANDKGDDANIVVRYSGDKKITGFAAAKIRGTRDHGVPEASR